VKGYLVALYVEVILKSDYSPLHTPSHPLRRATISLGDMPPKLLQIIISSEK
jgi:hypothetical protein